MEGQSKAIVAGAALIAVGLFFSRGSAPEYLIVPAGGDVGGVFKVETQTGNTWYCTDACRPTPNSSEAVGTVAADY